MIGGAAVWVVMSCCSKGIVRPPPRKHCDFATRRLVGSIVCPAAEAAAAVSSIGGGEDVDDERDSNNCGGGGGGNSVEIGSVDGGGVGGSGCAEESGGGRGTNGDDRADLICADRLVLKMPVP